jgi:hypothetical protein
MSHTMAASECVKGILECDPDISFMPYFFGIQLLHGSLLLLLVAYRLQADSGTAILSACEAVIRATEACFVTLPTDYQVRHQLSEANYQANVRIQSETLTAINYRDNFETY